MKLNFNVVTGKCRSVFSQVSFLTEGGLSTVVNFPYSDIMDHEMPVLRTN